MSILEGLRAARRATSGKVEIDRPYAGHEFGLEMEDLDSLISIVDVGLENDNTFTELELGGILAANTEENGKFGFGLESGTFDFGTEAVVETIKRAGYKGKAMGKNLINVVVGFVKRIINIVTNKNLIIKKYGTLFEKISDRLATKTFEKTDKKISIRDFSKIADLVDVATSTNEAGLDAVISGIESTTSLDVLIAKGLGWILVLSKGLVKRDGVVSGNKIDLDKIKKLLDDKVIPKNTDDMIKEYEVGKATEVTVGSAKTTLSSNISSLKGKLDEDVKVQAGLRKFVKTLEDKRDELVSEEGASVSGNGIVDSIDELNMAVNKFGTIVTQIQAGYTKIFKHTTSSLSALATDAQKVLAA
ncbi:MAG: hypothetical protein ACRCX8_12775 [Sarcina sp.]